MSDQGTRRYTRYNVAWSVDVSTPQWSQPRRLVTENVSRGGMFVRCRHAIDPGAPVHMVLSLPDDSILELEGQALFFVSPEQGATTGAAPGFGVQFAERHLSSLAEVEKLAAKGAGGSVDPYGYAVTEKTLSSPTLTAIGTVGPALPPQTDGQHPAVVEESFNDDTAVIVDKPRSRDRTEPAATVDRWDNRPKRAPAPASPRPSSTPPPPPLGPVVVHRGDEPVFGIDFGTTYASIAMVREERVRLLEDEEGHALMPSIVAYGDDDKPIVGWPARAMVATHPATTFAAPKRLLGRSFNDKRIEPVLAMSPIAMDAGPDGQVLATMNGTALAMPQVCAEILRRVAQVGTRAAGVPVRRVLLSAPVTGNDQEIAALRRSAHLAGLEVVAIIEEPVSAAIAYGLGRQVRQGAGQKENQLLAVYDFGGGTFDFTVLRMTNRRFEVVGSKGDGWLGGDDFDEALAACAADAFYRRYKVDLRTRQVEWQRLLFHSETAKRRLSVQPNTELVVPSIVLSVRGPIDLRMRFDRDLFAQLCSSLVDRSLEVVEECLQDLSLQPSDIDDLLMTGGVSRIPLVRDRVHAFFKQSSDVVVDPELGIVVGNAIYGRFMALSQRAQS